MQDEKKGILASIGAYFLWGLFPIYWKVIEHVSSEEILASRVIWSFVLTLIFVVLLKQRKVLVSDFKALWHNQRSFWLLFIAAYLVSINWFIYIWTVNHNHIVQTSLGYYMNPIISILLGIIFLKERLSKYQIVAFLFAIIGVLILFVSYGQIPWVAIGLALSFGIYGLLKKQIVLDATRGLVIETMFILPVALMYYIYLYFQGNMSFLHVDLKTNLFLIGTGIVTAIPLILFATGAQNIPLYLVGFIQYISPTMTLILGVVVYHESFGGTELVSFSFIWLALMIFSISTIVEVKKSHRIHEKHETF
ncbi:EamA family transporter RarD [uncultured Rummeliibacillus sp.]|uniref:EamA family transporter RarD n=1 Tax=uncultured Rummeliibacillus sp. TaxID=762292 RepID=UPI002602EB72|nr:EamA family transporter RarD [uncultured Rummeliibacillus sp.]